MTTPHRHIHSGRCLVAPHPDLQKKILANLEKAKKANPAIASMLAVKQQKPPGLDDGLIYPGDMFPLGTSVEAVRSAGLERAPLSGTVRVIVVLANFPDKKMTATKAHFEDLFFSTGKIATGSVREYYTEVTNGKIDIQGQVVGPYTLPKKITQYANGASGTGNTNPNARDMALDAANAANPAVNFSQYDNNGDGFVDAFIVIHAGKGAEVTGSVNDIWSHKWNFRTGPLNADGTKVYGYLTVPEDSKIGVCCHELGHLLFGWPDLYDTDYSSSGLGNWCLMAGGSWNGNGDTPSHPSAWCKANQGWVSVVNQTSNQNVNIPDVKTSKQVFRLWKDGAAGNEYFLVENRQRAKFDSKLPSDGLLIYHVDEAISSNSNEAHPKIALMQADGLNQLKTGANRGDTGDPYPGSSNNATFNKSSNPNSMSYGNVDTCVGVTNIGASGATMSARLNVKCKSIEKPPVTEKLHVKETVKETVKEALKETKETVKEIEKPITDKAVALEKPTVEKPIDKQSEKLGEGGGGGLGHVARSNVAIAALEARIAALESAVRAVQPFIGQELRPDISQGALQAERDYQETHARMLEGVAEAKRYYDSKVRESKLGES